MVEKKQHWQIMGASVCGTLHKRHHLPNQDAIRWYSELSGSSILAISDGHGSEKCFRSDRGSKIAVNVAVHTIKTFLKTQINPNALSKQIITKEVPYQIVQRWQTIVKSDLKKNPFSKKELSLLNGQDYKLAYGATLLIVLATKHFIIYWQIGDGDILTVGENGIVKRAVPKDEELIANQTTSICAKAAWHYFRCGVQRETTPKLILLATDGYGNSFNDDENFFQVGSDIEELIASEGPFFVRKNLESWLYETSKNGSGDDITLGLIFSRE